jgi:hypothetical protein
MNQTQSIIVYRNPAEQAFWETIMSGSFFPILVAIMVFPIVLLIVHRILDRVNPPKYFASTTNGYLSMTAGAVAAVATAWALWI